MKKNLFQKRREKNLFKNVVKKKTCSLERCEKKIQISVSAEKKNVIPVNAVEKKTLFVKTL